jgi:hypothetical protein
MSPCCILFRSVPVLRKGSLTEKCYLRRMGARCVFKNSYKGAARSRQMDIFKQSDGAVLVDHCFKRLNHVSTVTPFDLQASA